MEIASPKVYAREKHSKPLPVKVALEAGSSPSHGGQDGMVARWLLIKKGKVIAQASPVSKAKKDGRNEEEDGMGLGDLNRGRNVGVLALLAQGTTARRPRPPGGPTDATDCPPHSSTAAHREPGAPQN